MQFLNRRVYQTVKAQETKIGWKVSLQVIYELFFWNMSFLLSTTGGETGGRACNFHHFRDFEILETYCFATFSIFVTCNHLPNFPECLTLLIRQVYFYLMLVASSYRTRVARSSTDFHLSPKVLTVVFHSHQLQHRPQKFVPEHCWKRPATMV